MEALLTNSSMQYCYLVKEFSHMYRISNKKLFRRRFREIDGEIRNGFAPFYMEASNMYQFLNSMDIRPLECTKNAAYIPKKDMVIACAWDYPSKTHEFTHALTALPLLSRKEHVKKPIPMETLDDKEALDHLLMLDFTHRTGNYPQLRTYLVLEATLRARSGEHPSATLLQLEHQPEKRYKIARTYLSDISNAAIRGDFSLGLYSFDARVKAYYQTPLAKV